MAEARRRAREQFGVELVHEVELLGDARAARRRSSPVRRSGPRAARARTPLGRGGRAAAACRLAVGARSRRVGSSLAAAALLRSPARPRLFAVQHDRGRGRHAGASARRCAPRSRRSSGGACSRSNGSALERSVEALPTVARVTLRPRVPAHAARHGRPRAARSPSSARARRRGSSRRGGGRFAPIPTDAPAAPAAHLGADGDADVALGELPRSGRRRHRRRALALAAGFPARFTTASSRTASSTLRLRLGIELRLGEPVDVRLKLADRAARAARAAGRSTYLDVSVPERPVAGSNPQVSSRG